MRWTCALSSEVCHAYDVRCTDHRQTRSEEQYSAAPALVLPRRGVFEWRVGSSAVIADANSALLFHPRIPFRVSHPTDDGDDCTSIHFNEECLEEALGLAAAGPHTWFLTSAAQRRIQLAIHTLHSAAETLEREESALAILRELSDFAPPAGRVHPAVRRLRERLASNPSECASLTKLARDVGLSSYELARKFRAATGTSIHQYRLRLRLASALSQLRDGVENLTALALDLGFASHAHFTLTFTKAFGMPPKQARSSKA